MAEARKDPCETAFGPLHRGALRQGSRPDHGEDAYPDMTKIFSPPANFGSRAARGWCRVQGSRPDPPALVIDVSGRRVALGDQSTTVLTSHVSRQRLDWISFPPWECLMRPSGTVIGAIECCGNSDDAVSRSSGVQDFRTGFNVLSGAPLRASLPASAARSGLSAGWPSAGRPFNDRFSAGSRSTEERQWESGCGTLWGASGPLCWSVHVCAPIANST